jgi:signal transduction histidine kinase
MRGARANAARDSAARIARVLVGVVVLVVVSFLTSFVVGRARGQDIVANIEGVVNYALPSVENLAAARGTLYRLSVSADEYADAAIEGRGARADALRLQLRALRTAVSSYEALPFFDEERADRDALPGAVDQVANAIDSLTNAAWEGNRAKVLRAFDDEESRAASLDVVLERLIIVNTTKGRELGSAALEARHQAVFRALAIDGASVMLATGATILALVIVERRVRVLVKDREQAAERASHFEQRMGELDQFAGRVAHDVLSPLATVGHSLELARRRGTSDSSSQAALRRGVATLERVRRLVDGLLEFARSGAVAEANAKASVAKVVGEVVDLANDDATGASVDLHVEPFDDARVACSEGVLTSILSNLVANAIKHMGDSCVRRVAVTAAQRDGRVRVEIADTGEGVPLELREILFEPFVRAGERPGIGLGLATAQRLARGCGGDVHYEPREGGGSVFRVELPVASDGGR